MIYCVEDDSAIRDLMLYTLNASGFPAKGFPDSTDFWKAMGEERPELILLDIMLVMHAWSGVQKKKKKD